MHLSFASKAVVLLATQQLLLVAAKQAGNHAFIARGS